ncbi:MAG: ECF transporter S component [Christensenellales bacterium]
MKLSKNVRMLTTLSVLTALSIVLLIAITPFPLTAMGDLKYDAMDIPFLIAGFAYGPVAGITVVIIASFIQGLTVSASTGLVGIAMHIIASGALVLVSSLIYRSMHNKKGAIIGLAAGALAMAVVMIPANLFITAPYYQISVEVVAGMLLPFIIPFNLMKAGINILVVFLLYKPLRNFLIKK